MHALLAPRDHLRAERAQHPPVELDVQGSLIEERHDVAGADHPVRGMRPARERFDADELATRHVHLRLELQRQRALVERALQLLGTKTNDRHAG